MRSKVASKGAVGEHKESAGELGGSTEGHRVPHIHIGCEYSDTTDN